MQPEDFAAAVVTLVKNALTPVLERVAAAEARLAALDGVRDRVVTLETKSAVGPAPQPDVVPFDSTPMNERLAALEARLGTIGDLRDRVITIETKAAPTVDLGPLTERLSSLEHRVQSSFDALTPVAASVVELTKELAGVRERVAVAEVRPLLPGPAGKDGRDGVNGTDGAPGAPGSDGLGFDDLSVVQNDDRSFTVKAMRGDRSKDIGTVTFPVMIQRGVYLDGQTYTKGDVVTWGGSQWHANESTSTKPGEGLKAWTLIVKRGRDGKDGKGGDSGPAPLPVVRTR